MDEKKKKVVSVTILVILIVALVGISYALLQKTLTGSKENVVKAGNLSLVVAETSNSITLSEAYPMTDSEGLASTGFSFSVQNNGTVGSNYEISLEDVAINENQVRLSDENIKYSLTKNEEVGAVQLLSEVNRVMDSGFLAQGKSKTYELKLWLREDFIGEIEGQIFKTKLQIKAVQGEDKSLANRLMKEYTNDSSITTYAAGDKSKMYTFKQTAGEQQTGYTAEELTEYRYIGITPNNYITFNDEVWRIIGVFTVEDQDGKKEQRVKIMREESIDSFSYDNTTVENEYGKNRWSDARLMKVLNPGYEDDVDTGGSSYWNRQNSLCYLNYGKDSTTTCDFTSNGLNSEAKEKIAKTKWYLGGFDSIGISAKSLYIKERGNKVYSSSTYPRETNWIGYVGLMYLSDFGFVHGLGVNTSCESSLNYCNTSQWMKNNNSKWTLTPNSSTSSYIFSINSSGNVNSSTALNSIGVNPCVYLKSNVELLTGSGTSSDPFKIL